MLPPRAPWFDFPDAFIHAPESTVKKHPSYPAAQSGDTDAAAALVATAFNDAQALVMAEQMAVRGHTAPTLVSAHAYENDGVNASPEVIADVLGRRLGWPVDGGILQTDVVARTGADGWSRMVRPAAFDGPGVAGRH